MTRDLSDAAGGGTFELIVPSAEAPFVRTFNAALLVTGIVAVAALLLAAAIVASRRRGRSGTSRWPRAGWAAAT